MNRPPPRKSTAQKSFTTLFYTYLIIGVLLFIGWTYEFPYVAPSVSWATDALSPWLSPWIYKLLRFNNPDVEVTVTLIAVLFILFLISIPFLPMVEGWLIRDRLQSGERQGVRVQNIRTRRKSDPKADNTAR